MANIPPTQTEELDYHRFLMLRSNNIPPTSTPKNFDDDYYNSEMPEGNDPNGRTSPSVLHSAKAAYVPKNKAACKVYKNLTLRGNNIPPTSTPTNFNDDYYSPELPGEVVLMGELRLQFNFLNQLSNFKEDHKEMFLRLTEEVVALSKEVRGLKSRTHHDEISILATPCETNDELLEFEKKIRENEAKITAFSSEARVQVGRNS